MLLAYFALKQVDFYTLRQNLALNENIGRKKTELNKIKIRIKIK